MYYEFNTTEGKSLEFINPLKMYVSASRQIWRQLNDLNMQFHGSETSAEFMIRILSTYKFSNSRYLFTKWTDVLPQDLMKSRSCEITDSTFAIALKFDSQLGSSAGKMPVKFKNDTII